MRMRAKSAYMGSYIEGTKGVLGLPKKYSKDGLLLRGNGTLHLEEEGLRFDYMGIKREIRIPLHQVTGSEVAYKHMHRKPIGSRVLVVKWRHKGLVLAAGFALKKDAEEWRRTILELACGP